jgi:hypothetical protein
MVHPSSMDFPLQLNRSGEPEMSATNDGRSPTEPGGEEFLSDHLVPIYGGEMPRFL